jgi:hypothetical protein
MEDLIKQGDAFEGQTCRLFILLKISNINPIIKL